MTNKQRDLTAVLSYFPIEGLRAAHSAPDENYINGRYTAGVDKGCLFFHLSRGSITSRRTFRAFLDDNVLADSAVCGRVIAAFDAAGPDFWKPSDYDAVYPPAGYQITLVDIREALNREIARRTRLNDEESRQVAEVHRAALVDSEACPTVIGKRTLHRQLSFLTAGSVTNGSATGKGRNCREAVDKQQPSRVADEVSERPIVSSASPPPIPF